MAKRQEVPESTLIEMIRERLQGSNCSECAPTALSPIDPVAGSINWQVLEHPACSDPCQAKMLEICKDLAQRYDVTWNSMVRGASVKSSA